MVQKIRRVRKERAIPSFPHLLAQNHLLSAPLFPLPAACSDSSLGHGLGQAYQKKRIAIHASADKHKQALDSL